MAYTTIKKPSDYFNTKLYDGTGSVANVTGVGFQPDFTWIKRRNDTRSHFVTDVVRGAGKQLKTNLSGAETTYSGYLNAFISDGFTLGTDGDSNDTGGTYASWNWLASNTTASNTDGSITSTVSANTTSGFSIVKWTGTGANATIGHGLGAVPKMIIAKRLSNTEDWTIYHTSLGATNKIDLNNSGTSAAVSNIWNNTTPTNSLFYVGDHGRVNGSGDTYIAYCFAEVKGFSKFSSYTGAGSNLPFIYTGFKPAFIIEKRTDTTAVWGMYDNKRTNSFNPQDGGLAPDLNVAEFTDIDIDFLSNGFKIRDADATINASGGTYIYMAFAEEPLVGDNPATAR